MLVGGGASSPCPGVIGTPVTWAVKPAQTDALCQSEAGGAGSISSEPQKLSKEWVGCRSTAHKCESRADKGSQQGQRRWDASFARSAQNLISENSRDPLLSSLPEAGFFSLQCFIFKIKAA